MYGSYGKSGKAGRWATARWAAAVVCLVAVLMMTTPCAMGDASAPHCSAARMSGMCCTDASASRSCCEMHLKTAAVQSMSGLGEVGWRAEATDVLPATTGLAKPGVPVRETLTPSPPRHTILRI